MLVVLLNRKVEHFDMYAYASSLELNAENEDTPNLKSCDIVTAEGDETFKCTRPFFFYLEVLV